jgi:O-succinylbenzoate synthase
VKIDRVELHHLCMELVHPFQTSFGTQTHHPCVLVSVHGGGRVGWGECTVGLGPFYSGETISSAWYLLTEFLVPMVLGRDLSHPSEVPALLQRVRDNEMTKAGLENAIWDLFGRVTNQSVMRMIGGVRPRVPVGVSIGMESSTSVLLDRVAMFLDQGYRRVKIKIRRGQDHQPMAAIRARYPDLQLMADANSDYRLCDIDALRRLDDLNLLMMEQPLAAHDIIDHGKLQAQLKTPICLDESIHHEDDARHAIELLACRIINIKLGRVGGMCSAIAIHNLAQAANIPVWCGGMFETGVGRAMNLAMASLPNFTLPGDISATDKYFREDITEPFFLNREDSTMTVPTGPGIGVEVAPERLARFGVRHATFTV